VESFTTPFQPPAASHQTHSHAAGESPRPPTHPLSVRKKSMFSFVLDPRVTVRRTLHLPSAPTRPAAVAVAAAAAAGGWGAGSAAAAATPACCGSGGGGGGRMSDWMLRQRVVGAACITAAGRTRPPSFRDSWTGHA
jgi:hypothetical protein